MVVSTVVAVGLLAVVSPAADLWPPPHAASVANDNTNAPSRRSGRRVWVEACGSNSLHGYAYASSRRRFQGATVARTAKILLLQQGNSFIARSRWRPGRLERDTRHEVARMLCAARLTKDRATWSLRCKLIEHQATSR